MPGMGANTKIFEKIKLPQDCFEMHFLEWIAPIKDEDLIHYVNRIKKNILHANPVLIGVSFGGIIVQELSKIIPAKKTIIISSVRSNEEFPKRMKFAKATAIYKLFPTRWIEEIEQVYKKISDAKTKYRLDIFDQYMTVRDPEYLDWAFKNVILWKGSVPDPNIIHIHGNKDEIFPIQYIKDAIVIKGGTHAMILIKHKWFNTHLPNLILENKNEQES